ncbi:MAG TPA: ParB/RepB/Spo0J family partition protein, partial [Candidatus Anammoximicrobium sp.]|nr:ParB/RepB/Spo0J family partition protein [Candidatus Anammoximicrobium sp.]
MVKKNTIAEIGEIKIRDIIADTDLHPRVKLNENAIDDYAQAMQAGIDLPPIIVFQEGRKYHLADGWHRLEAARRIGRSRVMAEVRKGDRRDTLLYAVGANATHGLRRTSADKRKAVQLLLDDPEWQQWSVEAIAKTCNVSWGLVDKVRSVYLPKSEDSERQVKRGGSVFKQRVGKRKGKKVPRTPLRALGEIRKLIAEARLLAIESDEYSELTDQLPEIAERLEELVGRQTGAKRLSKGLL